MRLRADYCRNVERQVQNESQNGVKVEIVKITVEDIDTNDDISKNGFG